ncbi:peptide/nickel transport system substrate-binding protein [Hydrogenivirga caldilitoris]|uniref:Peptide/nickel transport system substrate-binding protein n=1 Tax=Hydrogenivirga caldilitoris TaxID=246264 RepID=A0A497XP12_9AQUI|nr:ABC transporter substrate-binding protein [Hydrogenivirga caldilitoris]RLJ70001.1 peptide/nickel transport system substrate-binding protein [Hydrogenivirga caldilitoris]
MRPVLLAFLVAFLAFFPFHRSKSPEGGSLPLIKVDPMNFSPKPGKEGGTLYFILNGDPKTLNPALAQETTSTAVIGDLFTGLTKLDLKTMEVKPDLAQSWEVSEKGRVWTFHLRRNIRWSDGEPFTAEDVVFTFNKVYYNDSIPSSTRDILTVKGKKIKVEKVDPYTVRFTLPEPFAPFLNALSAAILPKHKLERYVDAGTFNTAWNVNTDPREIVGTGPWVIKEYVKGQRVVYERNPYYYERDERGKRLPYMERKVGVIVSDPDTALLKFSNQEVDYIGLRTQDIQHIAKMKREDIKVYDLGSTPSTTFMVFNQNPKAKIPKYKLKWFQNRLFRVAISHAIDREGICYLVYNGLAKPLYTPITEANRPYYTEDYYPKFEYDLRKARQILESIGFRDRNGDGILEDPEGHELKFTLITNAGNKERETIGNIIKEDLKKIGIEVHFQPIDFNSLVARLTSPPYEWEAVIIGLTGSLDPHFGRNVWHSSGTLHMWYPRQEKPTTDWEAEVDRLIDLGAVELNFERRVEIYREAYRLITEQQPMIFIATPKSLLAVYDKFENLFPTVWGWYEEVRLFIRD